MPWTPEDFKERHWKKATKAQAARAAEQAGAMIRRGVPEGTAIAVSIRRAKRVPKKHA